MHARYPNQVHHTAGTSPAAVVWPAACCPPFFPPTATNPAQRPPEQLSRTPGGYLGSGFAISGPPFPNTSRSSIPAQPAAPVNPATSFPALPGYCRVADPCAPQRVDTESYRRAVHLGLITPSGIPAVDGVAVDAAERRALVQAINDQTTNAPNRVQISPESADFDHAGFSQEFG